MDDEIETIELDITDAEFLALAKAAHALDMTLNCYINQILRDYIESLT